MINKNINIEIEKKVVVIVDGGRGPAGSGSERLVYIAKIGRNGNSIDFLEEIINTTGRTFSWSVRDNVLKLNDSQNLSNLLSVSYYRLISTSYTYRLNLSEFEGVKTLEIGIGITLSGDQINNQYQITIEFYNI